MTTHTKTKTENALETHRCELEVRILVPQVGIKLMQYPTYDMPFFLCATCEFFFFDK